MAFGNEIHLDDAMPKFETVLIKCALGRTGGRRLEAARLLGLGAQYPHAQDQGACARRPRARVLLRSAPAWAGLRQPGQQGTCRRRDEGTCARCPRARVLPQSALAGAGTGLRLPGSRAPAMAATMAAAPSQTYSRSKLPLESKTQPAKMTVKPATPSARTNFAP